VPRSFMMAPVRLRFNPTTVGAAGAASRTTLPVLMRELSLRPAVAIAVTWVGLRTVKFGVSSYTPDSGGRSEIKVGE
jgi:hypothetical protein